MLRQKCFYRNDIETRKKRKSKEKIELKFAIYQKQVKPKLPAGNDDMQKMVIYDDFSKNVTSYSKSFNCFFESF